MRGDRRCTVIGLRPVPKMPGNGLDFWPRRMPTNCSIKLPSGKTSLFLPFSLKLGGPHYLMKDPRIPVAFNFYSNLAFSHSAATLCFLVSRERKQGKPSSKTGLPVWMLGMGNGRWEEDMSRLLALLFHQGVLDEHFMQLQLLQDESSPNFVSEVISIYFRESEKLLRNIRALLVDRECTNYTKIGVYLNHLMGSSSSIGANLVRNVCVAFLSASEHCNWAGCVGSLAVLEHEYCYLKNKLHELFQIEQQRLLAAGVLYHPLL